MNNLLTDHPSSRAVGFIHFSCFCGLDIYCLGISPDSEQSLRAIGKLKSMLAGQAAALFSTDDGPSTSCPKCGIELELPSRDVLACFARQSQKTGQLLGQPEIGTTSIHPPEISSGT